MDTIKRFFGGMLMEQKGDAGDWHGALGRAAFWLVFLHLLYLWQVARVIDASEMTVFEWLLAYNGFKIGASAAHGIVDTWKNGGEGASTEPPATAAG